MDLSHSSSGLTVLAPPADQNQDAITVDIVAVPGLGCDPKKSFGTDDFQWLSNEKRGIRSKISTARVLLFEYDSRFFGRNVIPQTIGNVASFLLDSLVAAREKCPERPIIFLGHSMGGLVVAKALTIVRPEDLKRMRICDCFAGAMFFGTPFGGSQEAGRAYMVTHFLEKSGADMNSQIVQSMEPKRDSLAELRASFSRLVQKEPKPAVTCYFELKKQDYLAEKFAVFPRGLGPAAIVVDRKSAVLDGAKELGLSCNHRDLNRYKDEEDGAYKNVIGTLVEMARESNRIVKKRLKSSKNSPVGDDVFEKIITSLQEGDFRKKYRSVETMTGDSSWILTEERYKHWTRLTTSSDNDARCLWISGYEGLGKSKAAAAAIKALEQEEDRNNATGSRDLLVGYFFSDSSPEFNNAKNLFRSLMLQLVLKRRYLAQYIKGFASQGSSRSGGGGGTNKADNFDLYKLKRGLEDMLQDPSVEEVYFVVNNLHYLNEDDKSTAEFREFIQNEAFAPAEDRENSGWRKVRWLFLSREQDQDQLKAALKGGMQHQQQDEASWWIDLNSGSMAKQRQDTAKAFTRDRVRELAELKGYSLSLRFFVTDTLQKRAQANNLWVEVVCRLLGELPADYVQVRRKLEAMPADPEKLIQRTWKESLSATSNEDLGVAKEILRTLAVAYEDPSIDDLRVLAEIGPSEGDQSEPVPPEKVEQYVRACGPLLRIYDDSDFYDGSPGARKVAFIHPIAKDTLINADDTRELIDFPKDEADNSGYKQQHGVVALRAFAYTADILNDGRDEIFFTRQSGDETASEEKEMEAELDVLFPEAERTAADSQNPYLDLYMSKYPVQNWLRHGQEASSDFVETFSLDHVFWAEESSMRTTWWQNLPGFGDVKGMTSVHTAAYFGLVALLELLLKEGRHDEIHMYDSLKNHPLHWAAEQGHIEAMNLLIKHGANVNGAQELGAYTPLHMAATQGKISAMRRLLEKGADIDALSAEDGTALTVALFWGQEEAAGFLLERGASPTLASDQSETPVSAASFRGFDKILSILLPKGGKDNLLSHVFGSALTAAARAGHVSIINALMQYDRDVDSYRTALEQASKNGFEDIVNMLLQHAPGPIPCGEAFTQAAFNGRKNILEELWKYHENNNILSQDVVDKALYDATDNEQEAVIDFLLHSCHAQPNTGGMEQGNAITASAFDGTIAIAEKLVDGGADLNHPSGYPLQAAASQGNREFVKWLLGRGADVNARTSLIPEVTALQAACNVSDKETAELLLQHRADPNSGGGDYGYPLVAATSSGQDELTQLLLDAGADPNVTGKEPLTTPLINAARALHSKFTKALIDHGARVDSVDGDGTTALIMAAEYDDSECINILLDHGADINHCGKEGGTALHKAAAWGADEACALLIKRGAKTGIKGGEYLTVLQAACSLFGNGECVKIVLEAMKKQGHEKDINAEGGANLTALHAAAKQMNDSALRELLEHKPKIDIVPRSQPGTGTPLLAAIMSRCSRNARLLLEAGADPAIESTTHGSPLQAAALKGKLELCELLLEHYPKLSAGKRPEGKYIPSGKYGNPLVAAVVRCYHRGEGEDELPVLELLLGKDFHAEAYSTALQKAFDLECRGCFKAIREAAGKKSFGKHEFNVKSIVEKLRKQVGGKKRAQEMKAEDENPDFADEDEDFDEQDFESTYDSDDDEGEDDEDDEAEGQTSGVVPQGGERTLPYRQAQQGSQVGAQGSRGIGLQGGQDRGMGQAGDGGYRSNPNASRGGLGGEGNDRGFESGQGATNQQGYRENVGGRQEGVEYGAGYGDRSRGGDEDEGDEVGGFHQAGHHGGDQDGQRDEQSDDGGHDEQGHEHDNDSEDDRGHGDEDDDEPENAEEHGDDPGTDPENEDQGEPGDGESQAGEGDDEPEDGGSQADQDGDEPEDGQSGDEQGDDAGEEQEEEDNQGDSDEGNDDQDDY